MPLADSPKVVGFFSYARLDDEHMGQELSRLRSLIHGELSALLGLSTATFELFQDKEMIEYGDKWEAEIRRAIDESVFFIPIITPRAIRSPWCNKELGWFQQRQTQLGRQDLIFPFYYIDVPELQDPARWDEYPILKFFSETQHIDWRNLRHCPSESTINAEIARFCTTIRNTLRRLSPQERREQGAAAAWNKIKDTKDLSLLDSFADEFKDTSYATLARTRAASLRALNERARLEWESLAECMDPDAFELFAGVYSDTDYAEPARGKAKFLRSLRERATQRWEILKAGNDMAALGAFAKEFRGTSSARLAQERIEQLSGHNERARLKWEEIKDATDIAQLEAFADEFKDTPFATLACSRADEIRRLYETARQRWESIRRSRSIDVLLQFAGEFRATNYAIVALHRADLLRARAQEEAEAARQRAARQRACQERAARREGQKQLKSSGRRRPSNVSVRAMPDRGLGRRRLLGAIRHMWRQKRAIRAAALVAAALPVLMAGALAFLMLAEIYWPGSTLTLVAVAGLAVVVAAGAIPIVSAIVLYRRRHSRDPLEVALYWLACSFAAFIIPTLAKSWEAQLPAMVVAAAVIVVSGGRIALRRGRGLSQYEHLIFWVAFAYLALFLCPLGLTGLAIFRLYYLVALLSVAGSGIAIASLHRRTLNSNDLPIYVLIIAATAFLGFALLFEDLDWGLFGLSGRDTGWALWSAIALPIVAAVGYRRRTRLTGLEWSLYGTICATGAAILGGAVLSYDLAYVVWTIAPVTAPSILLVSFLFNRALNYLGKWEFGRRIQQLASAPFGGMPRMLQRPASLFFVVSVLVVATSGVVIASMYFGRVTCSEGNHASSTEIIKACSAIIEDSPTDPRARRIRGIAYYNLGRYMDAIADFSVAVGEIKANPQVYGDAEERRQHLYSIYHHRRLSYEKVSYFRNAIEDYDAQRELDAAKPIELNAQHATAYATAYVQRGREYEAQDVRKAIRDYSKAIEIDKRLPAAFNARMRAYAAIREYRNAIEDYDKLVELRPNDDTVLDRNYGVAFYERGKERAQAKQYALAIVDFKRAIRWGLNNLEIYNQLAGVSYLAQDWASLFSSACTNGVVLAPRDSAALNFCGLFHLDSTSRSLPEAIKYFTRAIETAGNDLEPLNNRRRANEASDNMPAALADAETLLERDPKYAAKFDGKTKWKYAYGFYDLGVKARTNEQMPFRHKRAIQLYSLALVVDPGHYQALGARCFANALINEYQAALKDCDEGFARGESRGMDKKSHANLWDSRGLIHFKQGEYKDARDAYTKAIDNDQTKAISYYGRGKAKENLSDATGAADFFDAEKYGKGANPPVPQDFAYRIRKNS
jgi:tetratricopeptide (TPR) repeat protein